MGKNKIKDKIKRRERRFFRYFKDGKVYYSNEPISEKSRFIGKGNVYDPQKTKQVDNSQGLLGVEDKLRKQNQENQNQKQEQKDQAIKNTLDELSKIISPDKDKITDAIYSQIKNNENLKDVPKEHISQALEQSKHYRATSSEVNNSDSKDSKNQKKLTKDDMRNIVSDVFDQIHDDSDIKDKSSIHRASKNSDSSENNSKQKLDNKSKDISKQLKNSKDSSSKSNQDTTNTQKKDTSKQDQKPSKDSSSKSNQDTSNTQKKDTSKQNKKPSKTNNSKTSKKNEASELLDDDLKELDNDTDDLDTEDDLGLKF